MMPEKNYELIEHTADIGIRVKGSDLEELFANTAVAMFEIMAEAKNQGAVKKEIKIKLKADNLEELFINWLNELLSLSAVKELIFSAFKIIKLDKNNLEASLMGSEIKNYRINTEIKAATYHQLKLQEIKSGWQAEVIFDV
jgi:SHS2 domain-containing protein